MKVLYVKNGSQRDKKFQLQTMIFEEDGQRFVKKSALSKESLVHLYNIRENYEKLSNVIINPKVKLAKIIEQDTNSLTFEYIEGESLARRFHKIGDDEKRQREFIDNYEDFLQNSFKTTIFDSTNITDACKKIFGDIDYSVFNGELCFDGISNIDLIFSNIIYKNDEIYIIDYEWVFECDLPIKYLIYRLSLNNIEILKNVKTDDNLKKMELNFALEHVYNNSFYKYEQNYNKKRIFWKEFIQQKDQLISEKEQMIQKKDYDIKYLEDLFFDREKKLHEKELEVLTLQEENKKLQELTQSMRIKNRIKNGIKKILGKING